MRRSPRTALRLSRLFPTSKAECGMSGWSDAGPLWALTNCAPGSEKVSPLWNPMRMAREQGRAGSFNPGMGHFVCVDGFGPASPEERAAGMPGHGEAHLQNFELRTIVENGIAILRMSAKLPLVQENLTRTFRLRQRGLC